MHRIEWMLILPVWLLASVSWGWSSPLQRLHEAPAVFAFTHGYVTSVAESPSLAGVSNLDVHSAISQRADGFPKPNLVLYYACTALAGTTWFWAYFDVPVSNAVNQAVVGFDEILFALLKAGLTSEWITHIGPWEKASETLPDHLSLHTERLVARLAAGDTLLESVSKANSAFPPRGQPQGVIENGDVVGYKFKRLDMKLQGDARTTLNRVYGYEDSLAAQAEGIFGGCLDTWYISSEPEVPSAP